MVGVGEVTCCVMSPAGVSANGISGCCCSVDIVSMQMMRLSLITQLLVDEKLLKILVHLFSSCCALLRNFFSLWLSSSRNKNVLCGDQRKVGQSEKSTVLQSKAAGQIGELFVYDVVVFEFFLISVDVFDVNGHSDHFARKTNAAVDQAVSRLRAHEGLVALVVFFNVFVGKPLQLLVFDLHADGLLGFARRHQHAQLLTKSGNVRPEGGKVLEQHQLVRSKARLPAY